MGIHDGHRQRLRDKFRRHGLVPFADHEILELLLFYAIPRQNTNPIAHALLDRFGRLDLVFAASEEELKKVPGVGPKAATLINLVPEVYRRIQDAVTANEKILDTPERVGAYLVHKYIAQQQEVMYQLCLDAKGRLLACCQVSEGSVANVDVDLRKIVENALRYSAVQVVIAHNHPSGLALPSRDDLVATKAIKDALEPIRIKLVDHIIVAENDFVSLQQDGFI